ncbi:MAG: NADH-quinone oxidoreductase subunit NuoK [Planctomycetes bacterium]|nr:NADH-quinone oxidoreductase subunit NuoK [Planctomycetota bacterium]
MADYRLPTTDYRLPTTDYRLLSMISIAHMFFTPHGMMFLAMLLFLTGVYAVTVRRNLIVVLMGLELMLNAVNVALVSFNYFSSYESVFESGQIMALMVIAVAAAEAAVGLAILVVLMRTRGSIDAEKAQEMQG